LDSDTDFGVDVEVDWKDDGSIGHSAHALHGLFRAIPDMCYVGVPLDSEDVHHGFQNCPVTEDEHDNNHDGYPSQETVERST
jgi:hypothetical protein